MKKIKFVNFLFFFVIFVIILLSILSKQLDELDEIWNYNIARNIAEGLVPYKDISMITTPLLSIITAIFLRLIANELIITRILGAILATLILYSLYRTMKILKINNSVAYLIITILLLILKKFFCLDYNWAVALMGIIILNLELANIEKKENAIKINCRYEFLIGFLAGISICFKQSIGCLIAVGSILCNLIFINNNMTFKEYLKVILIRVCGIFLPIVILVIYLYLNDALYYFIDYCILGIKTFSNSISYINLIKSENIFIKIMSVLIPIMYLIVSIYIIIKLLRGNDIKILYMMLIYSSLIFTMIFPISNDVHFLIGTLPSMVLLIYIVYLSINAMLKNVLVSKIPIFINIIIGVILISSLINAISICILTLNEYELCIDLNHFKYIPINESLNNKIKNVDEYILNCKSKVYILDSEAVIYMIPIDRYNKDYDMFNLGNFGSRGEEGKIEDLKSEDDVIILLRNNQYSRNWQHPETVRKYIEDNWNIIDMINFFDVYEKGN